METLKIIFDRVCDELKECAEKIQRGEKISTGDMEMMGDLIDIKKNILKTWKLEGEFGNGYSHAGNWEAVGRMSGNYGPGYSSSNRGEHLVHAHYSQDSGRNGMMFRNEGGYSHDAGRSEMMRHLEMALDRANERDRENLLRYMRNLENG